MPMIRGRYYMNPAMGEALEEARARAEEGNAPRGSEDEVADDGHAPRGLHPHQRDEHERDAHGKFVAPGPVHRVEIESAEGGFIARLHRHPPHGRYDGAHHPDGEAHRDGNEAHDAHAMEMPSARPSPEVHVFTHHHDLVNFLRDELEKR